MNLIKDMVIKEVGAPISAASNTDSNSDRIDMAGYEGVVFITAITDSTDTGVCALTVEQNTSDSDTGMAALASSVATATSAADDDLNGKLLVVEVYRPRERYVQAVRTTTTANGAFSSCVAILYGARKMPITEDSTIANSAFASSPAES